MRSSDWSSDVCASDLASSRLARPQGSIAMRFRWGTLVTMVAAVNVVAISMWINPPPKLIWNASASVPIGFYTVRPASDLRIGDLAVVTPPDDLAVFLSTGGYLPMGVPLLKPVAVLPEIGRAPCREGGFQY